MSSSVHHEKQARNNLEKAGNYRGTRAGKKVQAIKQAQTNVSQKKASKIHVVQKSANHCSIKRKKDVLLDSIVRECTIMESAAGEPKNQPKEPSQLALKKTDGRPYRGKRAGKSVKVKENFNKIAMLLTALSKEGSKN